MLYKKENYREMIITILPLLKTIPCDKAKTVMRASRTSNHLCCLCRETLTIFQVAEPTWH